MERGPNIPEGAVPPEGLRIFDELASVRMAQADVRQYGHIQYDTLRQIYNEELTYVAEGLNAPLRTTFTLEHTSDGLVDERGTQLLTSLARGRRAAEEAAYGDSRLWFNLQRTIHDYHEGQLLESMMLGETSFNTLASWSPMPEEAYVQLGLAKLESLGYQPKRLLGFIRIYQKISDTELKVVSLSVDNSDLMAFRMMAEQLGVQIPETEISDNYSAYRFTAHLSDHDQAQLPAALIRYYDKSMSQIYGGDFSAGRRASNEQESWSFIAAQKDLVEYYFAQLEILASQAVDAESLRRLKRELTYGFWAALKDRYNAHAAGELRQKHYDSPVVTSAVMRQEVMVAYSRAAARHETLVGCGGAIGVSSDLGDLSPENAMSSIMSDKQDSKESWVWKQGVCRIDNCPTRPSKTKVGPCHVCAGCQHLFDKGKDPMKTYTPAKNKTALAKVPTKQKVEIMS